MEDLHSQPEGAREHFGFICSGLPFATSLSLRTTSWKQKNSGPSLTWRMEGTAT